MFEFASSLFLNSFCYTHDSALLDDVVPDFLQLDALLDPDICRTDQEWRCNSTLKEYEPRELIAIQLIVYFLMHF